MKFFGKGQIETVTHTQYVSYCVRYFFIARVGGWAKLGLNLSNTLHAFPSLLGIVIVVVFSVIFLTHLDNVAYIPVIKLLVY